MTDLEQNYVRYIKLKYQSKRTVNSYLNCFYKFTNENNRVYRLTKQQIEDYLVKFSDRYSVSYYNQMVSMLYGLYREVLKQSRKVSSLRMRKQPDTLQDVLTVDQVRDRILKLSNPKHRLILCMLYLCGLRVSELVSLKVSDVDLINLRIKVVGGKGNKDRYVPISEKLGKMISLYLGESVYLFCGQKGGSYSTSSVRAICKKVGINNPHLLRHSIITHLIDSGDQQSKIQMFAGHKSPRSTLKYYHLSLNSLQTLSLPK